MQSESHPHSHNQGPTKAASGSKEGLSIYGLFHFLAKTPQGKYLLRQCFLRPTLDLDIIMERQNTAGVFLRPDNDAYMNELIKSLKQIKNMKTVMIHLQKGMSNALTKGGGIKSGVWMSLRSVQIFRLSIELHVLINCSLHSTQWASEKFSPRSWVLNSWQYEIRFGRLISIVSSEY